MPICTLTTNLKEIPEDIELELTSTVAEILKKPTETITVIVKSGARMCRNGNRDPTCLLEIASIKVFDEEKNPGYTERLSEFLMSKLKIPSKDRVVLVYTALERYMVGYFDIE